MAISYYSSRGIRSKFSGAFMGPGALRPVLLVSTIIISCASNSAFAQSATSGPGSRGQDTASTEQLEEVVVTAQRTESRLQDTPLTVTAISGTEIANRQVIDVTDIPHVAPGVSVGTANGIQRVFIRGIGLTSLAIGQDSSIAFNLDGVAIGRPSAQMSSFYDIDSIEVLSGPQGTLYGRNATGGSINVITRGPTRERDGYAEMSIGNYNLAKAEAAIGGSLNDSGSLRGRIAMQSLDHSGYGQNLFLHQDVDDTHRKSVRGSLAFDLSPDAKIVLIADYSHENDHDYVPISFGPYVSGIPLVGVTLGGATVSGTQDIASDVNAQNIRTTTGVNATADYRFSDTLKFKSITAYRYFKRFAQSDSDVTTLPISGIFHVNENSKQFNQEFQINYTADRLKSVAGLFYYHEDLSGGQYIPFQYQGTSLGYPSATFSPIGASEIEASAAFGQASYEILPRLNLTAGVRYSWERRTSAGVVTTFSVPLVTNLMIPFAWAKSWNAWTPKLGIDYKPSDDVMLYASATQGFKSGIVFLSTNPPVNPESIWAYEAGVKFSGFSRHLTADLTGFYYDYKDLQVSRVNGVAALTVNAAAATVKGAEASIAALPAKGLTIRADVTYLEAKFTDFITGKPAFPQLGNVVLNGNNLPEAPRLTLGVGFEYVLPLGVPGEFIVRSDASYRSRAYFSEFNDPNVSAAPHTIVDASAEYRAPSGNWSFVLWGKNLTNVSVPTYSVAGAVQFGYALTGSITPPRTLGGTLKVNF